MKLFYNVILLMLIIYIVKGTSEQDSIKYRGINNVLIGSSCINTRIIPIYAYAREYLFSCSFKKESEKEIEKELVRKAKKLGGEAYKLTSPSIAGLPDRLVLLPDSHIAFVELKAPGKKPRKLQALVHERIKALGFKVYVVDSKDKIQEVLDEIHTS